VEPSRSAAGDINYGEIMTTFVFKETLVSELGLSEEELRLFEQHEILQAIEMSNRIYYADRNIRRAKAILHFMRVEEMSFERAREHVDNKAGLAR
jgi:hypothetical protein